MLLFWRKYPLEAFPAEIRRSTGPAAPRRRAAEPDTHQDSESAFVSRQAEEINYTSFCV